MKYTLYLTLLLFISCKTKVSENFNDITLKPTQKELINKYYKYDFKGIRDFKKIVGEKTISYNPIIYTNVPESKNYSKNPITFFSFYRRIPEEVDYFVDKMNGQYVLYLEKDGKMIMREYGMYYDFFKERFVDSIKFAKTPKINSEQQVYNYLKKNNIKYEYISKKSDSITTQIKLKLLPSGYYSYITFSKSYIVSNTYYNPKDTIQNFNVYGYFLFR